MNEILTGQPAHQEEGDENEEGHVEESQDETSEEAGPFSLRTTAITRLFADFLKLPFGTCPPTY